MTYDEYFMKKTLALAQRGAGRTSPNPVVGALVVSNGKIAGQGYHAKAGLPHAEVLAIREAKNKTKGSSLYVNLEPCDHFGRTPPCTDAIITSGIKRVVIGMRDPNPITDGRGIRKLKKVGITVSEGVLKKESEYLNRAFAKFITKKMPYVTIKAAQSLDGKIATKLGDSKWISGRESIRYVHRLRNEVDAVLVGINTVLRDDPLLTVRIPRQTKRQPKKIIIDSILKIPKTSRLLKDAKSLIIATTDTASKKKKEYLKKKGAEIIVVKSNSGKLNLRLLMRRLAEVGIVHILVEGGGNAISNFLEKRLADELIFFISPKIIGGKDAVTSVEGRGIRFIRQALPVGDISVRRIGNDILVTGRPIYK